MAILQVALDLTILERAVQIAKESVEGGVDWIEVGTPLIKSVGMDAVRTMKPGCFRRWNNYRGC